MMNRSVMQRQMFAKGGAAFPDLNKDGEITQADILMGRGVEFKQEGGIAGMMAAPAMAAGQAGQMDMPTQALQQAAGSIDPNVVAGMLNEVDQGIRNLDQAEDFETVMNAMRGDSASIEERRGELAAVVGPEDAAQTPESVLTLVQPVMQIAAIDQGLGGLAQEQMTAPVEGPMAGGIMSTVAPPTDQEAGGTPPVNFKDGGLVRRGDNQPVVKMQTGGDPIAQAGRLGELYKQKMPLYTSILGDPSQGLEEQKRLTQAQMLFDVANTALAFAAPMEGERPGMSPAERLAMAARSTQLPQTIGARAQAQLEREQAAKTQEQQMKLSALTAAEAGLTAEVKAAADLEQQKLKGAQKIAEIELTDALNTKRDLAVQADLYEKKGELQGQKFALQDELNTAGDERRLEIETQLKAIDLENDMVMESIKASNKKALQETIADQNTQLAILKADKKFESDTNLQASAAKISENLAILNSNLRIGELGVANEFDLEKLDITQGFQRELNDTNNALKEKLSALDRDINERRLSLDNLKAQVAAAQGEEKIRLQAQANAMQEEMNTFEQNYKNEKLGLEKAAARLTRLGTNTEARITTLISDPESLAKYAIGTMTPEETLEFNQAIAYYNAPKQVWNEKEKRFVLSPGNPLSNELMSSIRIRQDNGLTVPNIKLDEATPESKPLESAETFTNAVTVGLQNPMSAFGSVAVGKNVINNLFEFFTASAPFKPEKSAINAAKTLNQNFLQTFQKSAELRESVFQAQLLQDLTPKPVELFTGPEASADKVDKILGMITNAKTVLQNKIDKLPLDSTEYKDAQTFVLQMNQLEDGYGVFRNAYKLGRASEEKVKALQKVLGLGNKTDG